MSTKKDDDAKKDVSEKKNVRAETQDDLIQNVPGTRQVIIKLVDNHSVPNLGMVLASAKSKQEVYLQAIL